jgi:hypothetical protein
MSAELRALTEKVIGNLESGSTGASDVVNIASTMISSIAAPSHLYRHPAHMPTIVDPPLTLRSLQDSIYDPDETS